MKAKIGEIKAQLTKAASKYIGEDEAGYFADLVVDTHLRKAPRMIFTLKSGKNHA